MPRLTNPPNGSSGGPKPKPRRRLNPVPDTAPEPAEELFPTDAQQSQDGAPVDDEERREALARAAVETTEAEPPKTTKRSRRKAAPDPQPVGEAVDAPAEGESAEETPAEASDGPAEPKAKRRRPRMAVQATEVAPARMFVPDFSRLVPLSEAHDYLRLVVYGDGGVGKTTLVSSLANLGVILAVDPENSIRRQALRRHGVNTDNIMMWPDWTYDGLEQLYVTAKAKLEEEPGSIFAVMIDTVTALSQFWLEDTVGAALDRPSMKKKHPDRTQWDVFQDDYGVLTQQIQTLITRKFYQLPCHVVITAHARRSENEDGLVRVGPALSPAASLSLFTYSDMVLRLTLDDKNGKQVRRLQSQPAGQVEAKDRFGILPDTKYRTLEDIFALYEDSRDDGDE